MKNLLKFQVKVFVLTAILLTSIAGMLSAKKIAIIDAGSSGSRLYVYDINENGTIVIEYPKQGQESAAKGRALSSVANHSDSVRAFLDTMANKYTPQPNETIPLYVLATAGMRLVSESKADSIYREMHSQPRVRNRYRLETAMTISGKYEGFYAWIAANYKNGKLGFSISTPQKPLTYTGTPYGILEIGGASMQIAFAANQLCNDCVSRKGFSNIYSKSYLGGGVDQVFANKDVAQPKFNVSLDNIDHSGIPKFLGLGRPIGSVLDGVTDSSVGALNNYVKRLVDNNIPDEPSNYHPVTNAKYIAYVVKTLNLDGKLSKPEDNKKSDWTEGAALDIIINGEKPEKFNYQTKN